jgi:S2P endopeptidase
MWLFLAGALGVWVIFFGVCKLALLQLSDAALDQLPVEIELRPLFVRVDSTAFNRLMYRIARTNRVWLLRVWFHVGALWGAVLLVAAPFVMLFALWQTLCALAAPAGGDDEQPALVLTPIIPGFNVPAHELLLYVFAVALGAMVHEAGHAIAAAALECRINSIGFFVAFIAPGVFVDMSHDDLLALAPLDQLKVFCAGAWHNTVLAAVTLLLVFAQPALQMPFFVDNVDAGVTAIASSESPLFASLMPHDRIVAVDDCIVRNRVDWSQCLAARSFNGSAAVAPHFGYCISRDEIQQLSAVSAVSDCCEANSTAALQCFRAAPNRSFCLRSADFVAFHMRDFDRRCADDSDCGDGHCLAPQLSGGAWERILSVDVVTGAQRRTLMFRGAAESLWQTIDASDFSARWPALSHVLDSVGVNQDALPALFERFCMYVVSLNVGMAMLSVAPFYKWDGEFALPPLLRLLFGTPARGSDRERDRTQVSTLLLRVGTVLIGGTVLASLAQMIRSSTASQA